jgi:hypothetical protein
MKGWARFWLFMIIFILVEATLFLKGYDTFFYQHKTPNELAAQKKKLGI